MITSTNYYVSQGYYHDMFYYNNKDLQMQYTDICCLLILSN